MENIKKQAKSFDYKNFLINNMIYIIMLLMIIGISIQNPRFLQFAVLVNILTQASTRLIFALGVAMTILLAGTDLSLGRIMGFGGIVAGTMLEVGSNKMWPNMPSETMPLIIPLIVCILITTFLSTINGWVIAKFKMHPFIATFGMYYAVYGLAQLYCDGHKVANFTDTYLDFVRGDFLFGIPNLITYAVVITVVMWFLWNRTVFGKNMYAVGGNSEAAEVSGVSVYKVTILVFLVAGILYGIGGFLETGRVGSMDPGQTINYEFDAIAACVVGGVSFNGGIGKIRDCVIGVILFQFIAQGMIFLGLPSSVQFIVKGIIIVVAVALDLVKNRELK